MIGNLVANAIRHTPYDGAVEVSGRARGALVELSVRDACGGIPEEDLPRVFDVAWRGTPARTPEEPRPHGNGATGAGRAAGPLGAGAGLGLAIVRGIAEAHSGTVRVDNVGSGCRFLVELPA